MKVLNRFLVSAAISLIFSLYGDRLNREKPKKPELEPKPLEKVVSRVEPDKKYIIEVMINPAFPTLSLYSIGEEGIACEMDNIAVACGRSETPTPIGTNIRVVSKAYPFYFTRVVRDKKGNKIKTKNGEFLREIIWATRAGMVVDYSKSFALELNAPTKWGYPTYIHYTTETNSLGNHWSSGCIRMGYDDIKLLYSFVKKSNRINIRYNLARVYDGKLYVSGDLYKRGNDVEDEVWRTLKDTYNVIPGDKMDDIKAAIEAAKKDRFSKRIIDLGFPKAISSSGLNLPKLIKSDLESYLWHDFNSTN